jgi:hypothetical protein
MNDLPKSLRIYVDESVNVAVEKGLKKGNNRVLRQRPGQVCIDG